MYSNIAQLLQLAKDKPLYEVIMENEAELSGKTVGEVWQKFCSRWEVMQASSHKALASPQKMVGDLIRGQSAKQESYSGGSTLCGISINHMMAMALSSSEVNASMGRICAAPTAGACGILPAVLSVSANNLALSSDDIIKGLIVAAGFGAIITKNATVSGAEGGCQAECGVAAAMAAAGAASMAGGTAAVCANACALALINCMGLICDPVAGLVQLPCSFRNASQSVNALLSADLALAGQCSVIDPDEVVESMYRVGKKLP
ncbi:MAG: L-serine ammonia-lyase, iron-sulfur-dependent, subunit alpha, partial [Angelakisella sp.]